MKPIKVRLQGLGTGGDGTTEVLDARAVLGILLLLEPAHDTPARLAANKRRPARTLARGLGDRSTTSIRHAGILTALYTHRNHQRLHACAPCLGARTV